LAWRHSVTPANVPLNDGNIDMIFSPHRLRAAFLLPAFVFTASVPTGLIGAALAQSKSVEVPGNRQLSASETMASPGQAGTDYGANAPSLAGLTLLATIPAPAVPRLGYLIEAQCTAGLTVVLDDQGGSLTATIVVLQGSNANGGQGGSLGMAGMPHTGRIRIYSSSSSCQMAARSW
jgi:hypothetical protein